MKNIDYKRISKNDAVVLFIDHQTGLMSLVQDFPPQEFLNSIVALAKTAHLFNLPTILTTSFQEGPNGPLISILRDTLPNAPLIARPGEINAWDNPNFVEEIKKRNANNLLLLALLPKYV